MPDPAPLPNPEMLWTVSLPTEATVRRHVEARLGPTTLPLAVLSGGLANLSVRVGSDRVLRVFVRDPGQARKERRLLACEWTCLRVPRVLSAGDDFLVLEYVPHRAVDGSVSRGEAVGRALAEIHTRTYDRAGFLDEGLGVSEPFDDFLSALQLHVADMFGTLDPTWHRLREPVLTALRSLAEPAAWPPVLLHGDFKPSNLHWATARPTPLVLDWEFAYAGPALMDVGQLLRWEPPPPFIEGFAKGYRSGGHDLDHDWIRTAAILDLGNLVGLAARGHDDTRRQTDVRRRIEETLGDVHA